MLRRVTVCLYVCVRACVCVCVCVANVIFKTADLFSRNSLWKLRPWRNEGNPTSYPLTSYTSNNKMVAGRNCEAGATKTTVTVEFWNDAKPQRMRKCATFVTAKVLQNVDVRTRQASYPLEIMKFNLTIVQQDATRSVYYISVGSSTCFGCW